MHNGVLVETTVKDAIPDIESDIKAVIAHNKLAYQLDGRMIEADKAAKKVEEQMKALETKY